MAFTLMKVLKLKTENDFKKITDEVNVGSQTYYKCLDMVKKQPYYISHKIRKDGVLALWIRFEYHFDDTDNKVSAESWENVTDTWAMSHMYRGDVSDIYHKLYKKKGVYVYDKVIVSFNGDGKLNYRENYFCDGIKWLYAIQNAYISHMKVIFKTKPAPNSVVKEFLQADITPGTSSVESGIPKPKEGESAAEYYERVLEYEKDMRHEAHNTPRNEKVRTLKEEIKELKTTIKNNETKIKRLEKFEEIALRYPDYRSLRSHILNGERIIAVYNYYESTGDTESATYVKQLLAYGRQILDSNEEQE